MSDNLKKSLRTLRRDYFEPTGSSMFTGGVFFLTTLIIAGVSLFTPAGPPALLLLLGGTALSGGIVGAGIVAGKLETQKREEAWLKNARGGDIHIVGPGPQVSVLNNTQDIVDKLTKDLSRAPAVPQNIKNKLAPWLRDAEEAAKSVQAWDGSGNVATKVEFLRTVFNTQGQKVRVTVASFDVPDPNAAAVAAAVAAATAPIVVPKTITLKSPTTP